MRILPDWLLPLPDAEQVRAADRFAIEQLGIPGRELMERAASALADKVFELAPDGRILVVVGKGNNGGDGLAAARLLRDQGREVDIRSTCESAEWVGDAALMLTQLPGEGPTGLSGGVTGYSCVVDCILGTGASGAPRGSALEGIELVAAASECGALIVACDVPSGVNATSGEVAGAAVRADETVTFHAMKPGLWIRPGKDLAGQISPVDIGIPKEAEISAHVGLVTASVVRGLPQREEAGDKFTSGSVIVVGGSPGLTGAPMLSALGAARAGAGYVTAALPSSLLGASDSIPEIMGLPLEDAEGNHCVAGVAAVMDRLGSGRALVVGPGIGRSDAATAAVRELIGKVSGPLVLDADGLNAFAGDPEALADSAADLVLTPHAGETATLLGIEREQVNSSRLASARDLSAKADATVVLKGDDTIIVSPEGTIAVSPGGAPALATAGSGDVLSGVIAALLAKGVKPMEASCAGVLIHLEAGRVAGEPSPEGVLAGDIANALPSARQRLERVGR